MTITRKEYVKLMETALVGYEVLAQKRIYSKDEEIEGRNLVAKIDGYIMEVDRINGKDAERISIDVCAN